MTVGVVVPAAGTGLRLGPGEPKALRLLGGRPLLHHGLLALAASPSVASLVVAVPSTHLAEAAGVLHTLLEDFDVSVCVVAGGASRRDSVRLALAALPTHVSTVLVHDAARPFAPVALIEAVAAAVLSGHPAVIPGVPVADTVKRVDADGHVVETPQRPSLRAIQTPQGFDRTVLARAHALDGPAADAATDDAGLVELLGLPVLVVPGHHLAFKVTFPEDLARAAALLQLRSVT